MALVAAETLAARASVAAVCAVFAACATLGSMPETADEITFEGSALGDTGWARWEDATAFDGVTNEQVFEAAKAALADHGFNLKRANAASGVAIGEHGITPRDWNVLAGIYFKRSGDRTLVHVIAQGSRDFGLSGDDTWAPWPQLILDSMRVRLHRSLQRAPEPAAGLAGTGFIIAASRFVVTNSHVVGPGSRVQVVLRSGRSVQAAVHGRDPDTDVAVLELEDGSHASGLTLCGEGPQKGEEVMVLGYPLTSIQGHEPKATFGRVNSLSGVRGDPRFFQLDAPIQPGSSGSPVISKRGCVLGIAASKLDDLRILESSGSLPQSVNYAVKIDLAFDLIPVDAVQRTASADDFPAAIAEYEMSIVQVIAGPAGG